MIKADWECTTTERVEQTSRLCILLMDSIARDIRVRSDCGEIGTVYENSRDVSACSIKRKITTLRKELLSLEKQV